MISGSGGHTSPLKPKPGSNEAPGHPAGATMLATRKLDARARVSKPISEEYLPQLERLAKVVGMLAACFYAQGLLITNIYLDQKVRVTDFTILKPDCELTGAWATIILLLAFFPGAVFFYEIYKPPKTPPEGKSLRLVRALMFAFGACAIANLFTFIFVGIVIAGPVQNLTPFWPGKYISGWQYLLLLMNGMPIWGAFVILRRPEAIERERATTDVRKWIG